MLQDGVDLTNDRRQWRYLIGTHRGTMAVEFAVARRGGGQHARVTTHPVHRRELFYSYEENEQEILLIGQTYCS